MTDSRSNALRILIGFVVLSSCIGCDQATKTLATESLQHVPAQSYFAGMICLEYSLNPGGFLSLGSSLPAQVRLWVFIGLNSCFMLVAFYVLIARRNMPLALFVSILYLLAGSIGNLIDRISNHGLVIDFINIGIGPLRTGIFNIADVAVTFGGIATIYLMHYHRRGEQSPGAVQSPAGVK
jgi:signal peptidase II